jgi:hypothetical protein
MGAGGLRVAAIAALIAATALLLGCGESRHANQQRPNVSTRVSLTITDGELIVAPTEIGSRAEATQEIPQNVEDPEPPIKTTKPLDVTFVIANQTGRPSTVQIHDQSRLVKGIKVEPRSPGTLQAELPTGSYTISAGQATTAKPARLTVGKYRASSQNDVLLP